MFGNADSLIRCRWKKNVRLRELSPAGRLAGFLFLLAALAAGPVMSASTEDVDRVGEQLVCYCGCSGLTVEACTCGTADTIREEIHGQLDSGLSTDEVVALWVEERGEQILAVPTREGFNLVGWFLPFVATLLGLAAASLVVFRWRRNESDITPTTMSADLDAEYLDRVKQDVEQLKR
jgi:cytochrome c-type biogenesis protein CcmH